MAGAARAGTAAAAAAAGFADGLAAVFAVDFAAGLVALLAAGFAAAFGAGLGAGLAFVFAAGFCGGVGVDVAALARVAGMTEPSSMAAMTGRTNARQPAARRRLGLIVLFDSCRFMSLMADELPTSGA